MIEHIKERSHGSGFTFSVGQYDLYRFNDNPLLRDMQRYRKSKIQKDFEYYVIHSLDSLYLLMRQLFHNMRSGIDRAWLYPLVFVLLVLLSITLPHRMFRFIYLMCVFMLEDFKRHSPEVMSGQRLTTERLIN